ncbi:MAG TPA: amino acid permease [Actinomycetes bacterium]|nr:amino acid permease [Actinomycetes bacterium]
MTDQTDPPGPPPSRLRRRLGLGDAVVLGLGSMLGAGVFAAVGPAAAAAGPGLLAGLALAAVAAYCNATSSAALAAVHPASGGAYVYGRERLGRLWGYLAGWAFVAGKLASCAAVALTFGAYVAPRLARPLAVAAVVALAAVNWRGVARTLAVTRFAVALVLAVLALVVGVALAAGDPEPQRLAPPAGDGGWRGVLQAGALLFFAFAGYARIATLGEEVADPARTIPRAIPLALGIALAVYAAVMASALAAAGAPALAAADAPLAAVAGRAGLPAAAGVVRAGAAVACLGVLVSLLAAVARTAFAMGAEGDLPRWLAAVHPRFRVPHRAELAVAAGVVALTLRTDLGGAIGFSSFLVLAYYAIANAAALSLARAAAGAAGPGRRLRPLAAAGIGLCALLALALPAPAILGSAAVLAAGLLAWPLRPAARVRG